MALALGLTLTATAGAVTYTYYVDNQHWAASPTGPGTEAQPYNTISNAIAAHKGPGVTIIVKPGIYRETVTIPASGSSDAPFILKASGPGVIVDGADDYGANQLWVQPGAAEGPGSHDQMLLDYAWQASLVDWPVQQVFVNGRRLRPSSLPPTEMPTDMFTWIQGQGLYVNVDGMNPGSQQTQVGHRANGIKASGKSWVTIDGFDVRHTDDASIDVQTGCSDMTISNNHVSFSNSYGIRVVASKRIRIDGNVVSNGQYHGIGLTSNSTGCVIRRNESSGNVDPLVRRATGIYVVNSRSNILEANKTHDNQDTGIQFSSGSDSCLAYNNRSYNNGDHGFDHLDVKNTSHINDVAYHNYKDGFSIEGTSPGTQLYNCIGVENGLTTGEYDLWVNGPSMTGFRSDYNLFWNSNELYPIKFGTILYWRLLEYQAASGQDAHSIQANPLFANPSAGDFNVLTGSPAIDAATSAVANWPATDASGDSRIDVASVPNRGAGAIKYGDIGAEEFIPANPDVVQEPTPGLVQDPTPSFLSDQVSGAAGRTSLSAGYPNPSRGPVEFSLDLAQESRVEWAVYDVQGRVIWSEGRTLAAGRSQLRWDGTGSSGEPAAVGIYMVRAQVHGAQLTRRVVRF